MSEVLEFNYGPFRQNLTLQTPSGQMKTPTLVFRGFPGNSPFQAQIINLGLNPRLFKGKESQSSP
jgi:hypothetical protein